MLVEQNILLDLQKKIEIEICSACHPFYTGQEKVLDTAGRVDKFKKKVAVAASKKKLQKSLTI